MQKLSKGDTIGIIAPAFPAQKEKIEKGLAYLEKRGFKTKIAQNLDKRWGYFSAEDHQRATDIMHMFRDPEVKMILCARGGWGGLRVLRYLDFKEIAKNPKPLVGYSDVTTLQLALWQKAKMPSLSGPMLAVEMAAGIEEFSERHFWNYLECEESYVLPWQEIKPKVWREGRASGTLLGGCLSLVASQLGSPYCPDFTGAILFLEDIGEDAYKMDRYLAQLQNAGIFEKAAGVIFGDFIDCGNDYDPGFEMAEIISHYVSKTSCPVLGHFPYGHGPHKVTMPLGVHCTFDGAAKLFSLQALPYKKA